MRYKVRAPDPEMYQQVSDVLAARKVPVYVRSTKRHFFSTDDLPAELRARLTELGADVVPEAQYAAE